VAQVAQIPQIDNGKQPSQPINIVHIPRLPSDTPYGNLLLKGMNIVRRLDRVNLEVARVYSSYVHPKSANHLNPLEDILEHQFYAEQVVYWLRKTADELISIAYTIGEWKNTGEWPSAIKVDSIAGLKHNPQSDVKSLFAPHESYLFTLNDVANAFKHSFINTDMIVVGAEYPVVFALALDRNKLSNKPKFYSVSFAALVEDFSTLYKPTIQVIEAWAEEAARGKNTAT
jgi:hypothetical protein